MLNSFLIKRSVMYKLLLGFMSMALLVGCSSKEEKALVKSYQSKMAYHKNLQQTEKAEISDANGSIAIITATYLYSPNFEKNDTRDEVFIVGIHFEDSNTSRMNFNQDRTLDKATNRMLTSQDEYILTLNEKKPKKVTRLDANDAKLSNISFVTEWSDYYEVRYPHAGSRLKLVFENSFYGKADLNFSKVAKFVYTKKGF